MSRIRGAGWQAMLAVLGMLAGPLQATAVTAVATDAATGEPLTVFAAASLQGPLDTVATQWTAHSGRGVVISYAASSALARQIDQGAPAAVFVSADAEWMDWLAARGRIDAASRADLLGNELVLVAPANGLPIAGAVPAELIPGELGDDGRLAVAEVETVPAGRYAKQALQAIGRWDAVAGRLAQAENVRAALAFVARGEAPLGIVYATDAKAEPNVRIVARFDGASHAPIVYPVAVIVPAAGEAIGSAAHEEAATAAAFVAYLRSDAGARRVFADAGFRDPPPPVD